MLLSPESFSEVMGAVTRGFYYYFGSAILLISSLFLLFGAYLLISPFGNIRLGEEGDKPRYSTISWLAMLFAAGMGSGLLFWGVAEPLAHLSNVPPFLADEQGQISQSHFA